MRVPHTVSGVTRELYEQVDEGNELDGEDKDELVPSNFEWDRDMVPRLSKLTVIRLSRMFDVVQPMSGILQQDIDYLVEILPTNIDLFLTVKLIPYEIYWKRCCEEKWPDMVIVPDKTDDFWKRTYLAGYLRDYLETAEPESFDAGTAADLATLVCPYVEYLNIRSLKMVAPPPPPPPPPTKVTDDVILDECAIPEHDISVDHIPLQGVLSCLTNLTKVKIVFWADNLSDSFDWRLFNFSQADCRSICAGLAVLPSIKVLCVNRSRLDDVGAKIFLRFVADKPTLEEIDFSHCRVGDEGLMAVGLVLMKHETLKVVRLANNRFGSKGMQGLAFCLQGEISAPLETLDLRMNMLSDKSTNYLASALVRCKKKPTEILLSCCGFKGSSAVLIAGMLTQNGSITRLDISANDFSGEADSALLNSVRNNRRITYIERRFTGISRETDEEIEEILKKNMCNIGADDEELEEIIPPLYLHDPDYLIWEFNPDNPDYEPGHYPDRNTE